MSEPFVFNDNVLYGQGPYVLRDKLIEAGWNKEDPVKVSVKVDSRFPWRPHQGSSSPMMNFSGKWPATSSIEVFQMHRLEDELAKQPPYGSKREAAFNVYKPPFRYHHGYIYDANNDMVTDDHDVEGAVAARIRGWGKLKYKPDGAALQDELGQMVAEALTDFWNKPRSKT